MMYSEFVAGTGCRENDHNFKVFQHLEILYMESNVSKAEIYEMGKKLVDNSKTEEEIRLEKQIKEEIEDLKEEIEWCDSQRAMYQNLLSIEEDKVWRKEWKRLSNLYKDQKKEYNRKIRELKWVLAS